MNAIYPDSASFLITEDCNLACTYCFENKNRNHKVMSKEVIHKGLELICSGAKRNKKDSFHAMIFGGEPLLRPDLIEEIFKHGLNLSKKNNIGFTASIVTNATIMNDEIYRILTEYKDQVKLSIQLSVDGVREVQDANRIARNGKGSFELVEGNIQKFKSIYKNNPRGLSIHGCISRFSLPFLFHNYKFFREEWGMKFIWFMPVHEEAWEECDVTIYHEQLSKIADYILEEVKITKDVKLVNDYAPIDKCLGSRVRPSSPCGAGKNFVTITAEGIIYPCHHFYFYDPSELIIGNVWDGISDSKRRMFLDYTSIDMNCPKECDHIHCYRCIAVNYTVNGSILSQVSGNYCKMSYAEKQVQDRVKEELMNMGLVNQVEQTAKLNDSQYLQEGAAFVEAWVKNETYFERYNNLDGSTTVLDVPVSDLDFAVNNISCECGNEGDGLTILAAALHALIQQVSKIEIKQDLILKALNQTGGIGDVTKP